jgi:hypothetical protein
MNRQNYKLTFCEADTGILLDKDGSRWSRESGEEPFQPTFESLDEARLLKDALLAKVPNGEVVIESDGDGREVHRNDDQLKTYITQEPPLHSRLPPTKTRSRTRLDEKAVTGGA